MFLIFQVSCVTSFCRVICIIFTCK